MIERVHERLIAWAEEALGGYGVAGTGCLLGPVAMTRYHRRKQRVVRRDREGNIVELRTGEVTASGCQTRVSRARVVDIKTATMEVSEALGRLPEKLRDCVVTFYVRGDLAAEAKARRLGVAVGTMYRRRDAAHVILDSVLYGSALPGVIGDVKKASGGN